MHVKTHQQLQALEDEVAEKMAATFIRCQENVVPFEPKAFVLKQLKRLHAGLCAQHIHAPAKPPSGQFGSACAYCGYGHGNDVAAGNKAEESGVQV